MTFGADGLKPGLIKLFLDPFFSAEDADPWASRWSRLAARRGVALTREWGGDVALMTTMYGPPARLTTHRILRGRDIDPALVGELAEYIAQWVAFLKTEGLPVVAVSPHNEGEDYTRWPSDGTTDGCAGKSDYPVMCGDCKRNWFSHSDFVAGLSEILAHRRRLVAARQGCRLAQMVTVF